MSEADSLAFRAVRETCPMVDRAMDRASKDIISLIESRFDGLKTDIHAEDFEPQEFWGFLYDIEKELVSEVEDAFDNATYGVKNETGRLRSGMIEAYELLLEEQQKVRNLEAQIDKLEENIYNLHCDVRDAQERF